MSERRLTGIELARLAADSPEHRSLIDALDAMKGDLLIVLLNRLGGRLEVPVREIDAAGEWLMLLDLDAESGVFTFATRRKS